MQQAPKGRKTYVIKKKREKKTPPHTNYLQNKGKIDSGRLRIGDQSHKPDLKVRQCGEKWKKPPI